MNVPPPAIDPSASDPSAGMTRRELVAMMALAAGAFVIPRPAEAVEAHRIARRRAGVEGAGALDQGYQPKIYTPHEWATVRLLVDDLIPATPVGGSGGGKGGVGTAGGGSGETVAGSATQAMVPEFMDTMLDLEPQMQTAHRGGLAWLDHQCHQRFGLDIVACSEAQRHQVFDDIAYPGRVKPGLANGARWFSSFRDFVASGYFTSEIGVSYLGYEGNSPLPQWTGCPPANYQRLGVTKP